MANYSNTIEYKIKTSLDSSGLSKLQSEIAKVQTSMQKLVSADSLGLQNKQMTQSIKTLEAVRQSLNKSFDSNLKMFDTNKFNKSLAQAKVSVSDVGKAFQYSGAQGQKAFNSLIAQTASLDTGIKNVNTTAQKAFTTLGNTIRWGLSASVFETFSNSINRAVEYVKDLDRSLNDIRIVSGYSAEYMREFAQQANSAAKAIGQTTTAYTDASLIYIQQGKTLEESKKLAELTLKTANVTGQETAEVSEQLTALMNGYQVAVDDMEASVDKLAKVAAVGASNMEELATAASRVSSTANALGVSQDQLIAQLSTIISVTRLAPETIGNSLKTIFARLGDLKMGETLEDGVDMGSIGKTLDLIGIQITDTTGELRNMGDVLEELMVKWDELTTAEQQAVAVKLAGKYQYNNLIALLENSEMYNEQLKASQTSLGTINEQQQIYLDSLEAKLQTLSATFENFINELFNPDDIKPFIDAITNLVDLLATFTSSIGGAGTLAMGLGGMALKNFSGPMASMFENIVQNRRQDRTVKSNATGAKVLVEALGADGASRVAENSDTFKYAQTMAPYFSSFNEQEQSEYKKKIISMAERENSRIDVEARNDAVAERFNTVSQALFGEDVVKKDKSGRISFSQEDYITATDYFNGVLSRGDYAREFIDAVNGTGKAKGLRGNITSLKNDVDRYLKLTPSQGPLSKEDEKFVKSFQGSLSSRLSDKGSVSSLNTQARLLLNSFGKTQFSGQAEEIAKLIDSLGRGQGLTKTPEKLEELSVALGHCADACDDMTGNFAKQSKEYQEWSKENPLPGQDEVDEVRRSSADIEVERTIDQQAIEADRLAAENRKVAQSYLSIAGSISEMAFAWSALKNLGSIWSDEDLSIGDKLLQTFMNLAPTIMMATDAIKTFKTAMADLDAINTLRQGRGTGGTYGLDIPGVGTRGSLANSGTGKLSKLAGSVKGGASRLAGGALGVGTKAIPFIGEILIAIDFISLLNKKVKEAEEKSIALKKEAADAAKQKYDEVDSEYTSMEELKEDYDETGIASDAFVNSLRTLGEELDIQETESLLAAGAYDELAEKVKKAREEAQEDWLKANDEYIQAVKGSAFEVLGDYNESQRKSDVYQFGDLTNSLLSSIKDTLFNISQSSLWKSFEGFIKDATDFFSSVGTWFSTLLNFPGEILGNLAFMLADFADGAGWNDAADALIDAGNSFMGVDVQRAESRDYVNEYLNGNTQETSVAKALEAAQGEEDYGVWEQSRIESADARTFNAIHDVLSSAGLDRVVDASVFMGTTEQIQEYLSTLSQEQIVAINQAFAEAGFAEPFVIDKNVLNDYNPRIEGFQDLQNKQQEVPISNADKIDNMLAAASDSGASIEAKRAFAASMTDVIQGIDGSMLFTGERSSVSNDIVMSFAQGLMDSGILTYDALSKILSETYVPQKYEDDVNDLIQQRNASMMKVNLEAIDSIRSESQMSYDADMSAAQAKDADTAALRLRIAEAEGKKLYEAGLADAQRKNDEWNASIADRKSYSQMAQEQLTGENEKPDNLELRQVNSQGQEISAVSIIENLYGDKARSAEVASEVNSIADIGNFAKTLGLDSDSISAFADAIENDDYFGQIGLVDAAKDELDGIITAIQSQIDSGELSETAKYNAQAILEELTKQRDELNETFSQESVDNLTNALTESTNTYVQKFFSSGAYDKGSSSGIAEQVSTWLQNEFGLAEGEVNDITRMYTALMYSGMDSADALNYLATQAVQAGDAEAAANIQRQNYEKNVVDSQSLVRMLSGESDETANRVYSNVEARALTRGGEADWDTYAAIVQYLGGDLEQSLRLINTDLVDITRDFDSYGQELDEFFTSGAFDRWRKDDIYNTNKEGVKNLVSAQQDDEVTGEIIRASGANKDIVEILEGASGQSDALSDVLALSMNQSFGSQRSNIELGDIYQQYEYQGQVEEIQKTEEEITKVEQQISDLNRQGIEISVDGKSIEELEDELDTLKDQLDDQEFSLDVNIAGDLLDKADQTIEAIKDVQGAIDLINDDYTIDASNLEALVAVFPDILDNATLTADGLVQLDQQVVDSSIGAAQAEVAAAVGTDRAKIESAIQYAGAMSDQYSKMSWQYGQMAENEKLTDEQLAAAKGSIDAQLADVKAENSEFVDQSTADALENQASNDAQATQAQLDNSEQATTQAITNLGSIGVQSGVVASQVIQNAQAMYNAIASIGTNTGFVSGAVDAGRRSAASAVGGVVSEANISDAAGPSGSSNDGSGIQGTPQKEAADLSAKYAALAQAWNEIQGQLQARLFSLDAAAVGIGNGVGSGSGSGGSGGGGGSEYSPKTKEYQEDEIDRYEKVDTLLDAITADYEKLNAEQERLIGLDLADNITEQIYLLRQQIDLQKEKLGIQKEEAEEYRKELADRFGVQFNDDGFITNYAERYKAILGTLNDLITAYNNTASEEGQEALEEQIDFAQETYDDFVDLIDKYDEMISSTIKDTEQQLEDLEDEIEDLNISMFQKAVESTDSIKDLNEALVDFNAAFSGLDSDNPFREMEVSAKKLAGYFDVAAESADAYYDTLEERYEELMGREGVSTGQKTFYQRQIDQLNEARKSAGQGTMEQFGTGYLDLSMMSVASIAEQIRQFEENGISEIFGKNSADLYDTAKSVFEQATDLIADYEGEVDTLRDAIVSAIDDVAERMDERKEQYEAIVDALEHQASIIQMIHGDQAYEKLNQVLAAQQHTYRQQIAESQQQIEYWEELLGHMEEGSEEYKSIQEQITSTQSSLNDLIETSLENLQQQYTNIVNKITDQWAFSAMGNDLDWIAQEWELINRNADYYLDDVNAAYNIQKLQADYLDLLDDATSLDVQQQITEQMSQQLGYLREKEKLSEYDVAYAQAQLEILQRQIALQEAQANKSQMKLRRDSQGNYSYVYTANEDDVKSAQGDLLDAQNNAYNLSKDQMKATQDDSISALQEAQDLINNLWTNANLTLDQKKERTQAIIDSLKEYLAGTSEQLSTSEKNIINDFIGMAEILTDENRDHMDDVYQEIINGNKDAFDQIDTRWSTSITAWLTNMEQFNDSTDDMFADLVNGADEYQSQIDDIADLVKQDFDDMSDSIQNCVDKTNDLATSNADFINQLREDSGVIREYEDRLQDYASRIADAQNAMRSYQTQVNELQGQLVAKEQENTNLTGQIQDLYDQINFGKGNGSAAGGAGDGSGTIGTGGAAGYGTSDMAFGIAQNIWTYGVSGGWGNNPVRSGKLTDAYGIDFAQTVQEIINARIAQGREGELVDFDSKKFSSYSLLGYDTGGYTGDWGDGSGRLALLHTKELVLNREDTDNILQAVQAVRAMTVEIKGDALNRMVEFVSRQAGNVGTASEAIDQEVHITATFPNATSADDIREAILGLNGQVLQYAHRK